MAAAVRLQENVLPSSSPAFGTPAHPFNPVLRPPNQPVFKPVIPTILPILLPPATLRPLAFRTFTKKHNLTLGSSGLAALATFVGRHCGSGWRDEGIAEKVLDEIARSWKRSTGPVIVEDIPLLKTILKTLEGCMNAGRIVSNTAKDIGHRPAILEHQTSFGISGLDVNSTVEDEDDIATSTDPLTWLAVISAFSHPLFSYNAAKSHFISITTPPSLFPPPSARTRLFRDRYSMIHSLIHRNPAFQTPTVPLGIRSLTRSDSALQTAQQNFKLTPIANLLGRSGTSHLLLGMLAISPAGTLTLQDLTGSVSLDLAHARFAQVNGRTDEPWIYPGTIMLIEGVYQEEFSGAGAAGLGGGSGVGGLIGGKFIGFGISVPPVERRDLALGNTDSGKDKSDTGVMSGQGFGWTSFLPSGSEKATGSRMRRLEERILLSGNVEDERRKVIIMSEVNLDIPECLAALRAVLQTYSREKDNDKAPLAIILIGNFVSSAIMAEGKAGGSVEYKENYNALANVLIDFPGLLRNTKWIFVPGDNDAWASAFSAGSSIALPQQPVPNLFTSRIKRACKEARTEGGKKDEVVEEVWASNPARISLFGTAQELCIFRDDISGRMRRTAINYGKEAKEEDRQMQATNNDEAEDNAMNGSTDIDAIMIDEAQEHGGTNADTVAHQDTVQTNIALARKLVLSLLPQASLSPFPLSTRPQHWDYACAAGPMSLYPLPHTLVLADSEAPAFAVTYEGCHVMNPGTLLRGEGARRRRVGWLEYDTGTKRGEVKELWT